MRSADTVLATPDAADDCPFRLLGPFQICLAGTQVRLGGKLRCLLAAVLLQPCQPVSIDYLIDVIWGQQPPKDPRGALHSYVMRVRKLVGGRSSGGYRMETTADGYSIYVSSSELDLLRFTTLRAAAQRAGRSRDSAAEASALRSALALWRGNALADVPSDVLREGPGRRLEEMRIAALQRRIELDLALGQHHDLVPELTELTSAYPLREIFWQQLLRAQHRAGQRAEALESYRRAAAALRAELGVDPCAELQELHRALLNGATPPARPAAGATAVAAVSLAEPTPPCGTAERGSPASHSSWARICQLPRDIPDFVGRHDLIESVLGALSDSAGRTAPTIVSISGPTGIGKTASAIRIAHLARDSFPDGQFYTSLGGTSQSTSSAVALRALLRATGVMAAMAPGQPRDCAAMLREQLADRRALMVLDDAADPDQVEQFLPGTAGCAVVITSRPVLWALSGVWHLRLPPLAIAETRELLERIAGPQRLHREPAEAMRLAEHCGGYPLAARIAAARLVNQPALPVSWLTERLADDRRRLDTLTIPGASMRSGLAASYQALAPTAQRALRRIASLASSELTASELIGLIDEDAEHAVEDLYSANLLESAGLSEAGELRYRLPSLVATYARERTDHDDH